MTLKTAALLALIGTILMTALLMWTFFLTFLNVLRDLVPVVTLFSSFIYAFGCFSVAVFFLPVPQGAVVVISAKLSSHERLWRVTGQEGDPAAIWLPGGVQFGSGVSQAFQPFRASLSTVLRRSRL